MSGFGIRKHNAGRAIVRFLIGLFVIAVCVLVLYEFVLNGDFSSLIERSPAKTPVISAINPPEETNRPEIIKGSDKPVSGEENENPLDDPDNAGSMAQSTPEPTLEPTAEPTATPTPAPTPIPESEFSQIITEFGEVGTSIKKTDFKVIDDKIKNCLTAFELSAPNDYKVISLTGWAYPDDERFDGSKCSIYIVILDSKGATRFYQPAIVSGVTGTVHEGKGKNLNMCEFMATIDVSDYENGDYQIGVGIMYKPGSTWRKYAYTFGAAYNFTTVDGVVTAVGGVEVS
ncbi:MAG: hypothetical protein E7322_04140 [Clostridiales bacterium]|nr:hypothetical protein [Clostridiales bacterium]